MSDKELRLLAFDGGGIRGLSSLLILQRLMQTIDSEADLPPKPCEYFDMIAGTSTGGLIAIMLGRLQMSIDECIAAYTSLSDRVFQKKTIIPIKVKGELRERFDSEKLKQVVKEMITKKGLEEDALLKDEPDAICKVFVCATSRQAAGTVCLTSYRSLRSDNDLLKATKIWEACRATSAASSFFDPITIGPLNEEFLDGGTGANNPVWELWHQAQIVWGHQMLEKNLKCLVSIGTGVSSHKPFKDNVFRIHDTLIAMATETEQTAERFRKDKSHLSDEGRYFRFNVWHGLEDIGLEESKKIKDIAAVTRKYLSLEEVYKQMEKCASSLRQPISLVEHQPTFTLDGDSSLDNLQDNILSTNCFSTVRTLSESIFRSCPESSKDFHSVKTELTLINTGAGLTEEHSKILKLNLDNHPQLQEFSNNYAKILGELQTLISLFDRTDGKSQSIRGSKNLLQSNIAEIQQRLDMQLRVLQSINSTLFSAINAEIMTTLHRCFNNKGPEKSEGSASSYHTAESLTQDEKESWRLARKQLMEKGFTPAFIEQHLASIFTIMADIVDSDLADPVEDVDVNEHFGLKTANIPHEMGLIAIDNASTRSGNATESMSDNGLPIQQYLSGLSVLGYEASGGSHFLPLLKRNRPLTLSQIRGALLAATMKPILSHRRISGSIYLLRIHDGFEYVKIGMTYRNPLQRREEWKRQCPTIREYAQGYEYQTVPFPFRLEELIFTELRDKRARLYCIGCNIIHQEWFEASLEHVKRVIQKWTDWIEQNPYERESENTDAIWKLKSTIDYSKLFSISQPLENL